MAVALAPNQAAAATARPTVEPSGDPCIAVVKFAWDLGAGDHEDSEELADATGVRWELKKGSRFTNATGPEPGRAGSGTGSVAGSVTFDLRAYGPVLNGTSYYFRIVARKGNQDLLERSEAVEVSPRISTGVPTVTPVKGDPSNVTVSWELPAGIRECSDRVFLEIKKGADFINPTGADPDGLSVGSVAGNEGSKRVDLSAYGPGDYYFRIVGKYRGGQQSRDVGSRGAEGAGRGYTVGPSFVSLDESAEPAEPTRIAEARADPTVTPTPTILGRGSCAAEVTYGWDVRSVAGADSVDWELRKGTDFPDATGPDLNRVAFGTRAVNGRITLDMRDYGPALNGTNYYFRVVAKRGNEELLKRSASVIVVDLESSLADTVAVESVPGDGVGSARIRMSWNVPVSIAACIDRVFYEVKKGSDFLDSMDVDAGSILHGTVNGTGVRGSVEFDLESYGPGDYYFRIVGQWKGNSAQRDVGLRGMNPGGMLIAIGNDAGSG